MTPASANTSDTIDVDLHQVIYALSDALDLVGIDDLGHGKRVGIMAAACAEALGKSRTETAFLFDLGMLHDIGVSHHVKRMDYREYGGACLLGVNGNVIIAHGRSQAKAIKSAVRLAMETAGRNIVDKIREGNLEQANRT